MNLVPAAQYLRMSTEHQQYSTANQSAAIADYAVQNGFAIVKTYSDESRSGVVLKRRTALQQLLRDVQQGSPYKAILVYDVSRWGRFQDIDESAYYEYFCKRAGIPVHYCAEQFSTMGTLSDVILKNLKRAMAAEFSRELGERVLRGKHRLVGMGYSVGGSAPYGLRRLLISADGIPKQILRFGEHKSISTDRVKFVLGPRKEVEVVQKMFQLVAQRSFNSEQVTNFLNDSGIKYFGGRRWYVNTVRNMLRNPKYVGTNVWGRYSARLSTPARLRILTSVVVEAASPGEARRKVKGCQLLLTSGCAVQRVFPVGRSRSIRYCRYRALQRGATVLRNVTGSGESGNATESWRSEAISRDSPHYLQPFGDPSAGSDVRVMGKPRTNPGVCTNLCWIATLASVDPAYSRSQ